MATFPSPGARHTSLRPLAAHADHHGRAFLYVLVAAGPEDLLKIGAGAWLAYKHHRP